MSQDSFNVSPKSQIVDLGQYRLKKKGQEELARGRTPLYLSHNDGKLTGSPHLKAEQLHMGDRIARIKASLERINKLMQELKSSVKAENK